MVYSISQDGVHYVRETGGGTVFAARMNQRVGFYQLNTYGYMMPVAQETLDTETAGRLSKALLQCQGSLASVGRLVHPERTGRTGSNPELMPETGCMTSAVTPRVPSPPRH